MKEKRKRKGRFAYYAAAAIVVAVAGYFAAFAGSGGKMDSTKYSYALIRRADITQSVTATGVIKPEVGAEVKVGAQVSGTVERLYVEIGSKVRAGQILALIAPGIYRAGADEALARKQNAAVKAKYCKLDLRRDKALYKQGALTKQQLENASERCALAEAELRQAEAECESSNLRLSYTRIHSPIDGVVASIATQQGETVAANFTSPTFVRIINLKRLELWAYVDETDIGKVRKGQRVEFYVDTYPDKTFDGAVKTIFPGALIRNNVVYYVTVVTITDRRGLTLRPEMDATASIYTEYRKDVPAVPKRAVMFDDSGRKYVRIMSGGKVKRKYISTGISDNADYQVISGLTLGEKVILN